MYHKSLFIFRHDLRLSDNTALLEAQRRSRLVVPCFIFDPKQSDADQNPYSNRNALQFMLESLKELQAEVASRGGRLNFLAGDGEEQTVGILRGVEALFINSDYTDFGRKRDLKLETLCRELGVAFHSYADCLLHAPDEIKKRDGKPYTIFTPFFKRACQEHVQKPDLSRFSNFCSEELGQPLESISERLLRKPNQSLASVGGRTEAQSLLASLPGCEEYDALRDFPAKNGTSRLSPHLRFGTCSIREAYHAIKGKSGAGHSLIRQLYWRDFFTQIAFHFRYVFGSAFKVRFNKVPWENNLELFEAWCRGQTGFPLVDAGMRELNETGGMHNRVRMLTASFLTKDLHIDWRWGEEYFARKLVDYDPCLNNGNWQWAASTGCDAQPYFRVFNPWLQQAKFDPEGRYIKRWLPELDTLDPPTLHKLEERPDCRPAGYPAPVMEHAMAKKWALKAFEACESR
jgi:deoxyribodipyrimidine photo-lyase